MAERDADIEFDFFDEPETRESARGERSARRGPRRPGRPPAGITPLLRLMGLIAFAIVVVVLLVLWIQSCQDENRTNSYRNYMDRVSGIAVASQQNGRELAQLLATPGLRRADLARRMRGLVTREEQNVENARNLSPPGRLIEEHEHLIEALQFRVSGLVGLAATFDRALRGQGSLAQAGTLLAEQGSRLLASDVVWDDRFKDPAKLVLRRQDIGGVRVPDSNFLENRDLASAGSLRPVIERIRGAAPGQQQAGIRGTNLVSVRVLPDGTQLSPTTLNKIIASDRLAFEVTVEDSGEQQEVQIPVTLRIAQDPPIVKRELIELINPGEERKVVFDDVGEVKFRQTMLRVEVKPVENERLTTNNAASYPVIFSLPD